MTNEERDKTIEQIERIQKNLASVGETVDYLDFAIAALEAQQWISVSERLPEYTTDYLVMVGINYEGMGMTNEIRTALYHAVGKNWMVYEDKRTVLIGEVIAWRELPSPYKEGKADDE